MPTSGPPTNKETTNEDSDNTTILSQVNNVYLDKLRTSTASSNHVPSDITETTSKNNDSTAMLHHVRHVLSKELHDYDDLMESISNLNSPVSSHGNDKHSTSSISNVSTRTKNSEDHVMSDTTIHDTAGLLAANIDFDVNDEFSIDDILDGKI